eukprot:1160837-Pelagomonas_calceolata.AAC.3
MQPQISGPTPYQPWRGPYFLTPSCPHLTIQTTKLDIFLDISGVYGARIHKRLGVKNGLEVEMWAICLRKKTGKERACPAKWGVVQLYSTRSGVFL